MRIDGLQKMTLLDFPGRVACTVFTAGCNFRCPFCHNAPLVTEIEETAPFTPEGVLEFLQKRKGLLDGVAVTGGEPLLQPGLDEWFGQVKALGFAIKLDTNGSSPDKLKNLVSRGLVDYVAMDIKNSPAKYPATAGIRPELFPAVRESAAFLLSGAVDYEFRTTVVAQFHEVSDFDEIGAWIRGAKRYFLQPFVDSGDLIGKEPMNAPDEQTLDAMLKTVLPYVERAEIRGQ